MTILPAVAAASPEVGLFHIQARGRPVPAPFLTKRVTVEQVNYVLELVRQAYKDACVSS